MIGELEECAEAYNRNHPEWGKGYVGGFPGSAKLWSAFKKGDFGIYFGSWAPFYNLHKMYAGLRDAWLYCDNEKAKSLFLGFCDWAIDLNSEFSGSKGFSAYPELIAALHVLHRLSVPRHPP